MRTTIFVPLGIALLLASAPASSEITRGELMAHSCFACHGPDGQGTEAMPPIRGHSEDQLVEIMKAFREGERDPTVMDRHAKGYSDEEIREMAAYLSELE